MSVISDAFFYENTHYCSVSRPPTPTPNVDEESVAIEEVKALGEAVQEVELSVQVADVDAALNSNLPRGNRS